MTTVDEQEKATFGATLRQYRVNSGISLRQLAQRVHYSAGWLSRVENGEVLPNKRLAQLCDHELSANGVLISLVNDVLAEDISSLLPDQLPHSVDGFIGQERELNELDAYLHKARQGQRDAVVIIDGPPGVGKTALAIRWARSIKELFPDGVLFVDLQGYCLDGDPIDPSLVLEEFLTVLGLPTISIPTRRSQQAAMFRSVVAKRRLLIMLDNAIDSHQIGDLLPAAPGCLTLITSRRRLAGIAIRAGGHSISLDPLPAEEAYTLLYSIVGEERMDDAAAGREICEYCMYLPFAIRVAAQRLALHARHTMTSFARELAKNEDRLDLLTVDDGCCLSIRDMFTSSYRRLEVEGARAFQLLSGNATAEFDSHAAADVLDRSLRDTRILIDSLISMHMLNETAFGQYAIPDLLRLYGAELHRT